MRSRRTLGAALACCALLVSGCNVSAGDRISKSANGRSAAFPPEQALARAQEGLLRVEDLPPGWRLVDQGRIDVNAAPDLPAGCEYLQEARDALSDGAFASFEHGSASIEHHVAYASPGDTQQYLDAWRDDRTAECVHEVLLKGASPSPDVKAESIEVRATSPEQQGNAAAYAASVLLVRPSDGARSRTEVRYAVLRSGPAVTFMAIRSLADAPVDTKGIERAARARLDAIAKLA